MTPFPPHLKDRDYFLTTISRALLPPAWDGFSLVSAISVPPCLIDHSGGLLFFVRVRSELGRSLNNPRFFFSF